MVNWFVQNGGALTDEQSARIIPWYRHMMAEGHRHGIGDYRPFGQMSIRRVLEHAGNYERSIEQFRLELWDQNWESHDLDWDHTDAQGVAWSVREITCYRDLHAEGVAMHHCVASYAGNCRRGTSAIFSLRRHGVRYATVEISLPDMEIRQAKLADNRELEPRGRQVLEAWLGNRKQRAES
jgi:hypothetical protein